MTPLLTIAWWDGAVVVLVLAAFIALSFAYGFLAEAHRDWQQHRRRMRVLRASKRR